MIYYYSLAQPPYAVYTAAYKEGWHALDYPTPYYAHTRVWYTGTPLRVSKDTSLRRASGYSQHCIRFYRY